MSEIETPDAAAKEAAKSLTTALSSLGISEKQFVAPDTLPTVADEARAATRLEEKTTDIAAFAKAAVERDYIAPALDRLKEEQGYPEDYTFAFPEPDTPDGREFWSGIDTEDVELFAHARSREHFEFLKRQYLRNKELDARLAEAGILGVAGRFGLNVLDPVGLAMSAAAAPLGIASKASRLRNAVRTGLIAGGENAAFEAALAAGSMDRDSTDVVVAATLGFGLGNLVGAAIRPQDAEVARRALDGMARDARAQEIVDVAETLGQKLDRDEVARKLAETETPSASPVRALVDVGEEDIGDKLIGGDDSAGAARASIPTDIVEDDELLEQVLARPVPKTAAAGARLDYNAILQGDDDEFVRAAFGPLVDNPVGNVDHSAVRIGATAEASRIAKVYSAEFQAEADKQWNAYRKRMGLGWRSRWFDPEARDEFMKEVGYVARNIPGDWSPEARALAAKQKELYERFGDELVEAGVLAEKLDDFGMKVQWNHDLIEGLIHGTDDKPQLGTEQVKAIIRESIRDSYLGRVIVEGAGDSVKGERALDRLAGSFLRRVREVGRGIDLEIMHGISARNVDYVREMMEEAGTDAETVAYVYEALTRAMSRTSKDDAGRSSLARHRMQMDYSKEVRVTDHATGRTMSFRAADLLENNAEIVFHKYARAASGRIAIARTTGMVKDSDFKRRINMMKSRISDPARRARIENAATDVYNFLVGRPLEQNPEGAYSRFARMMRNFNMARLGSTFGIAQIADLGNVAALGGIRGLIGGIPEFRSIINQLKTRNFTEELTRELVELSGLGLDHLSTSLFASEYDELFGTRAGRMEYLLRAAARGVAVGSGMTRINEWSQVLVGKLIVNRFDHGKMFSARRLAAAGLTVDEAQRIREMLRKHATHSDGRVQAMNIHKWEDQALAHKFVGTVRKLSARAVQENDFGATIPLMHTTTGKLITQFRSFMIVAWSKQTLHNFHVRDWESFYTAMWGLFFGALSYVAYVAAATKPDQWAERLTTEKLASAAFSRTGWASILPMMVDTPLTLAGFDPILENRSSGLPSNAFGGIATVEAGDRLYRLLSGGTQTLLGNEEFSARDLENARRLLIGGNFVGMAALSNVVAEGLDLPED